MSVSEHPLTSVLRDAMHVSEGGSTENPVDGSIVVYTVDGRKHLGQVCWVSDDGQCFSLLRIWESRPASDHDPAHHDAAETPRHFATMHVIEIHYYRAGA